MQKVIECLILSERSYYVFVPQGFVTKCFLIFIVDEVKNFAANIFFKLVSQSCTGSHSSLVSHVLGFVQKGGIHILKSLEVLKRQKVSAVSSSTRIVESRDKGFVLDLKLLFTIVNCFSKGFSPGFLLRNQFVLLVFLSHHILSYLLFRCA